MRRFALLSGLTSLCLVFTTCRLGDLVSSPSDTGLTVSLTAIQDSAPHGSLRPVTFQTEIADGGSGSTSWTSVTTGASEWLRLSESAGTAPTMVTISLDPIALPLGAYHDTIIVSPSGASGTPIRVPVMFAIHPCLEQPVQLGTPAGGELDDAECAAPHRANTFAKVYGFDGVAGDSISVVMASADFKPWVVLTSSLTPDTVPIAESGTCADPRFDACLRYVQLPQDGRYLVEATSETETGAGVFSIDISTPRVPNAPASLGQFAPDSISAIGEGSTIPSFSVVLKSIAGDPDPTDSLWFEVEVRPVGTSFSGSHTHKSGLVPAGTTAAVVISGLLDNTGYHWQARLRDRTNRVTGWLPFGANVESSPDFSIVVADAPNAPTAIGQFRSDQVTPVPVGGIINEQTIVFRGVVSDPDPTDLVRLEVELRPVGTPFVGVPSGVSVQVGNGATATATVSNLSNNTDYIWQARTIDQAGNGSTWVSFGGNGSASPDFSVRVQGAPNVPAGLAQLRSDGTTTIPVGGTTPEQAVTLRATISDPVPSEQVQLEVEVRPVGTVFSNVATATSALVGSNSTASVSVSGLQDDTNYHWQARTVDGSGSSSAWVAFGGNTEAQRDFRVSVPAVSLAFATQPSNTTLGSAITPPIVVEAREAAGQVDTAFAGSIQLAITSGTGTAGAALTGQTSVLAAGGRATFSGVSVDRTGTGYTITASTFSGLPPVVSSAFNVAPAVPTQLGMVVQPGSPTQSGIALSPAPSVQVLDANGNPVALAGTQVTAQVATGPAGAVLANSVQTTDGTGRATFGGLSISGKLGAYTFDFVASGLTTARSSSVTMTIGAAFADSTVAQVPATGAFGVPTNIRVTLRDVGGNPLTSGGDAVRVDVRGATTATPSVADNGNGTYDASYTPTAAGVDSVFVAVNGVTVAASPFLSTVTGPIATQLRFVAQPSSIVAGASITPAITVEAVDGSGNPAPTYTGAVTVTITPSTGTSGANLLGTTTRNAAGGLATFSGLSVDSVGTGYTLTATASGLSSAVSGAFNVTPGAVSQLSFTVQPSSTMADIHMQPFPQVTSQDALGNTSTTLDGAFVFLSIAPGTGTPGAVVTGVRNRPLVSGVATYDDVSVDSVGTGYVMNAFASSFVGSSSPFDVIPATADPTNSSASILPNPGVAGSVTNITVTARDNIGNRVPGAAVSILANGAPLTVLDNGNGTYSAAFTPVGGIHVISIKIGGIDITGSPFTYTVN